MQITKTHLIAALFTLSATSLYSCKAKKAVVKTPPAIVKEQPKAEEPKAPAPAPEPEKAPAPEKPDYNFANIQFEFNSSVLKTASFQTLDKVTVELKKDPEAKFVINGHSSAEGTPEHNQSLSVDRANAVKSYLVNAGFDADKFTVAGFGESKPVASNATEEGRAANRRVEIKVKP